MPFLKFSNLEGFCKNLILVMSYANTSIIAFSDSTVLHTSKKFIQLVPL